MEISVAGVLDQTGKGLRTVHGNIGEYSGMVDCQDIALLVRLVIKGEGVGRDAVAGAHPCAAFRGRGVTQHGECLFKLHRGRVQVECVIAADTTASQ